MTYLTMRMALSAMILSCGNNLSQGTVDLTGGEDGKLFGCNIRIYPTANMLRGAKAFLHLRGE